MPRRMATVNQRRPVQLRHHISERKLHRKSGRTLRSRCRGPREMATIPSDNMPLEQQRTGRYVGFCCAVCQARQGSTRNAHAVWCKGDLCFTLTPPPFPAQTWAVLSTIQGPRCSISIQHPAAAAACHPHRSPFSQVCKFVSVGVLVHHARAMGL